MGPRVLHLETGRHLYGGALQALYLMEGLDRLGWENHLICDRNSEIAEAFKGRVHEAAMAGEMDPRTGIHLLRLIREIRPDILHVHSRRGADFWGGLAAMVARIPAVITRRVDNPEPAFFAKLKYRLYDRVIAISEGIRRVLVSEGVRPERISLVHSAVDTDRFQPACDDGWFRREFQLAPREKVIGVIAQLIPRKGHAVLIEAMPAIAKKHPDVWFLFLGKGPLKARLQEDCRLKGIQDRVMFAGFRNDVDRILPCLDLVVHPALMEGLGVSLLQASACGVPVVASRVGGIPETIRHGENGLLVPPGNPAVLEEAINVLLGAPQKRLMMGKRGRRIVSDFFSIPRMVEGNAAVYGMILKACRNSGK